MFEDNSTEVWIVLAQNNAIFNEYWPITIIDVYDNEDAAMDVMCLMMYNIVEWRKEGEKICGDNDELWDKHWEKHPYKQESGNYIEKVFVHSKTVLKM